MMIGRSIAHTPSRLASHSRRHENFSAVANLMPTATEYRHRSPITASAGRNDARNMSELSTDATPAPITDSE